MLYSPPEFNGSDLHGDELYGGGFARLGDANFRGECIKNLEKFEGELPAETPPENIQKKMLELEEELNKKSKKT